MKKTCMKDRDPCILIACADSVVRDELAQVLQNDGYAVCLAPVPLPERLDPATMDCDLAFVDHSYVCTVGVSNPDHVPMISVGGGLGVALSFEGNPLGLCDRLARPIDADLCLDMVSYHLASARQHVASKKSSAPQTILQDRLAELEQLGGSAFVSTLVSQFMNDARSLLHELELARARMDIRAFRDHAHALRSCAANVGAQALFVLCLSWRDISATDLDAHGDANLAQLQAHLGEAEAMFRSFVVISAELEGDAAQAVAADVPVPTLSQAVAG